MRWSMPMPIRFGGVPTGVPMPPIDAPNDVISIIASANLRIAAAELAAHPVRRCATIDRPIGNIIAVVAVLLIHIEMHGGDTRRRRSGCARRSCRRTATTVR